MTLPFRRRHHDDEASHDRARAIWSVGMLEPIEPADEAWLAGHLASCLECRVDRERYVADRALLRTLREHAPEPPRDLWARTSAALERESGRSRRAVPAPAPRRSWLAGWPLGAASGLLVVVVVVGATLISQRPIIPPPGTPGPSSVAHVTLEPGPTPLQVAAADVGWIRAAEDGSWEFIVADVDTVCPNERPGCPNLQQSVRAPLDLTAPPVGVTRSPARNELVVIAAADDARPGRLLVVDVQAATPGPTPGAGETATPPGSPTPVPTIAVAREIATGIEVIGDPAYSDDGRWLAFTARPSDGSSGPDLYLWQTGDATAVRVTSDGRTYFSSWLGDRILASRVEPIVVAVPSASAQPASSPDGSAGPGSSPTSDPAVSPEPSDDPVIEGRPVSFVLDPATNVVIDLAQPDVWLPVVDPTRAVVVYWSGSVIWSDAGGWAPGAGQLVLDRWLGVVDDAGTPAPGSPSPGPPETAAPPTDGPSAVPASPAATEGPAGTASTLLIGPIAAFEARFDPTGGLLALWTVEHAGGEVGTIRLVVVDLEEGTVDDSASPLDGVPAAHGFSIDRGRLAWVTPPGQDGRQSSVQVLAWTGREFGRVETIPADQLIVLR